MDDWLSLGEAARVFNLNRRTLQYAVAHGHLAARKLGSQWVTTTQAVRDWLCHGKHVPGRSKGAPWKKVTSR